jgi:hypothetical protein
VAPLREEGIQKPSGGRPHGGGDDEEDSLKMEIVHNGTNRYAASLFLEKMKELWEITFTV